MVTLHLQLITGFWVISWMFVRCGKLTRRMRDASDCDRPNTHYTSSSESRINCQHCRQSRSLRRTQAPHYRAHYFIVFTLQVCYAWLSTFAAVFVTLPVFEQMPTVPCDMPTITAHFLLHFDFRAFVAQSHCHRINVTYVCARQKLILKRFHVKCTKIFHPCSAIRVHLLRMHSSHNDNNNK